MGRRRSQIALTLVVGLLAAAWGALGILDSLARAQARTVHPLELRAGTLVLDVTSGDVEVVASDGPPRLEVEFVSGLFGGGSVRVGRDADGRVTVDASCAGPFSAACASDLRVLVPSGTAVEVATNSGEVLVRGIRGGVRAESGSGDIALEDAGGPALTAETGSGSVSGLAIAADRLRARTGSGDVELALARAPRDTEVETGSGDVDLTVPDVTYRVGAETGSGDQRVTVDADDDAPRSIRVQTGSGDVTVRPG